MKNKNNHPIHTFLKLLDDKRISYVCWKDLNLLDEVFAGEKDLDIIVLDEDKNKLVKLAQDFGALLLRNRFEISDDLIHLFFRGDAGSVFHIHIYTRLFTGESWVKEYYLPIEREIIDKRVWDHNYKLWLLPQNLNQEFIVLRYFLKTTSLLSFYSYRNKKISAKQSILKLKNGVSKEIFLNLSQMLNDIEILHDTDDIKMNYFFALKLRKKFSKYRRFSIITLFFRRWYGLYIRIVRKYFLKEKKILLNKGVIFAITGVDGSGKSSLITTTGNFYSKVLTTRLSHTGRPYPGFINKIFLFLQNKKSSHNVRTGKEPVSILRSIFALVLALLRFYRVQKINRLAQRGYLILVDRWPTMEQGKMDGPRIKFNEKSNLLTFYLSKIESYIYEQILSSDVCVILKVTERDAQLRNKNRIKVNKETHHEIKQRYYENFEFRPKSKNIICYENTSDFVIAKEDIIQLCWMTLLDLQQET